MSGHDHDHSHEHDHGHDHGHGHDHEHGQAQEIVENALVISRSWTRESDTPVRAEELEKLTADGLEKIAVLLSTDGMILGHIKALLGCGSGRSALSVTRLGIVDITHDGRWEPAAQVAAWSLDVNIISIENTGLEVDFRLVFPFVFSEGAGSSNI